MKNAFFVLLVLLCSSCIKSNQIGNIESQDRVMLPSNNQVSFEQQGAFIQQEIPQSNDNQYKQYNRNSSSSDLFQKSSGYFGAITSASNNINKNGYLGVVSGMYSGATASRYVGGFSKACMGTQSVAGTGYTGGNVSMADLSSMASEQLYKADNASLVTESNIGNDEYPKASYGWENPSKNQAQLANPDCERAGNEIVLAKQTEVLADKLFYYRKALRLCPESAEYHNGLGEVYLILNRKNDAEFEFKESLRLNPLYPTAQKNLKILTGNY